MANYNQFQNLSVTSFSTADFVIRHVSVNGHSPTIKVRSAGLANKDYKNAVMRGTPKSSQIAASRGKVRAEDIDENLRLDRKLYPRHIIVGWSDLYDSDGNEVPYSQEEAANFVNAIPDWIFQEMRAFCEDIDNFTGEGHIEVEPMAKKSAKTSSGS